MEKTIIISGIPCKFKSSAAIPRMYRMKFRRDIFVDMQRLKEQLEKSKKDEEENNGSTLPIESLEMFENIAYLMHRHGDPDQPKNINDWLEQFAMFDIYTILPDILEMWGIENIQTSTPKKKQEK